MIDLNGLINPALQATQGGATAINDRGQIVADGRPRGASLSESHIYLLTPIPEPSTVALFGLALLGLGTWARVR
ncbi:MAG: PEP-CTERM sorting domain-containing protein [Bryobacteraceae bacterium]